jgi:excisionase family DNA binding protein
VYARRSPNENRLDRSVRPLCLTVTTVDPDGSILVAPNMEADPPSFLVQINGKWLPPDSPELQEALDQRRRRMRMGPKPRAKRPAYKKGPSAERFLLVAMRRAFSHAQPPPLPVVAIERRPRERRSTRRRAGTRGSPARLSSDSNDPEPSDVAPGAGGMSRFLTVEEVAERLRCSTRTVHGRAARGEIPVRKLPGVRRLLFDEADLDAWAGGAELEVVDLRAGGRVVRPKAVP